MGLQIMPAGANFADPSMPIAGFDTMLNGGTLAMIDFANAKGHPAQNAAFGDTINLVPGKPSNVYNPGSGGVPAFTGGGMAVPANAANMVHLRVGSLAAAGPPAVLPTYDLSTLAANTELLVTCWHKCAALDTFARALLILSDTGAGVVGTGKEQLTLSITSAVGYRLVVAGQVLGSGLIPSLNAVRQYAAHIRPNSASGITRVNHYLDGQPAGVSDMPYAAFAALVNGGLFVGFNGLGGYTNPGGFTLYRSIIENITLSTRDPEIMVAEDYAGNASRFS